MVSELVEEVTKIAFSVVYSHYLEEQAFPHSVGDTKHSLLKIIELYYTAHVITRSCTVLDVDTIIRYFNGPIPLGGFPKNQSIIAFLT